MNNVWVVNRTTECIQNLNVLYDIINTNTGALLGEGDFKYNQSITMSTNSNTITEADSVTFVSATAAANQAGTVTFTSACGSGCKALTGAQAFVLAPGQVKTAISETYVDNPAAGNQDLFNTSYTFSFLRPEVLFLAAAKWSSPDDIRCDNQLSPRGVGCVIAEYIPDLPLSVATYGAAAKNVEYGEDFMPGTPGLTTATPLTRGDVNMTQGNRSAVYDSSFVPLPRVVPTDSCDEYPFASSQQSGGNLGHAGPDCLDIIPYNNAGTWEPLFLNSYTGAQPCMRGHVPSALNSAVGSALGAFYTTQRMLASDPYTVNVIQ